MAKFYVKSGKLRRILNAATVSEAVQRCVAAWKTKTMGKSIRVSEVGFDASESPHHADDVVLVTNAVKELMKKKKK